MALFLILGLDGNQETQTKRAELSEPHCDALRDLQREGRLHTVGPLKASESSEQLVGSVIIADFENQQAAEEWFDIEPYNVGGVYEDIKIIPFVDAQEFIATQG